MQFSTLPTLALFLVASVSCAPTAKIAKRDMCTFIGQYELDDVIGSGGPGQAPVDTSFNFLGVQYVGGVGIWDAPNPDSIDMNSQTFKASDTKFPNDITWSAVFDFGFKSCSVEYEGTTYNGSPKTISAPAGGNSWECDVDFPCEGNLA